MDDKKRDKRFPQGWPELTSMLNGFEVDVIFQAPEVETIVPVPISPRSVDTI